jgi:glycerol-3-phosphate O-acyltransferase
VQPEAHRRVVYLLDAASKLEARQLHHWVERGQTGNGHPAPELIPIPASRQRGRGRLDPRLEACLAADDDPLLTPLRVAWLPPENGGRGTRLRDLLVFGDPRDPSWVRAQLVLRRDPDRCSVVLGEAASASELRERWRRAGGASGETTGFAEYVARQAALALERAERRIRGSRYKVPRFVREDILARPAFRGQVARLARETGKPEASALKEASKYLKEIAATHSPYMIDVAARLTHLLYTQGYGETLHYDHERLATIYALSQRHPVVFLPSHKSNLDHLVLQYALHENGHPPNHTAGGINMNFFPVGPLMRRSGVFFIRRTFKDNELYKLVLRHYIDYLIEKRFPLEWYPEGGRSRSGKLLPLRYGLLANVVDAYRRGKAEDVHLIPVAIAYDQITDVQDYTAEQRGAAKQRESFGWFLKVVRNLRRRYGDIHIRFGEPISLRGVVGLAEGADGDDGEQSLAVQKLAFDVAVRINRSTPITPTSLVTLALLGVGDRALTMDEIVAALQRLVVYVRRRQLPTTAPIDDLEARAGILPVLAALEENGVVTSYSGGPETVYAIGAEQHLTASYYRNTIIHFFVNGAIAELALLRAAEDDVRDPLDGFWDAALQLRDLFKFEFYFAEKDAFRAELAAEVALHDPSWEDRVHEGPAAIQALVRRIRPFSAHRVLLPFLEAYRVVGDLLAREPEQARIDEPAFLQRCLALGKQYELQRRIRSAESLSQVLFATALKLARNRGLLEPGAGELAYRRRGFATEIRDVTRRADVIDALAASRRAGVID